MPLAEKELEALGQRVMRKPRNVFEALREVGILLRSDKKRVRRRDHPKFAQKIHERIVNFSKFRRAMRTESVCLSNHARRKLYNATKALNRVHWPFRSEKSGARRRDHAKFTRKNCKISGISARLAQRELRARGQLSLHKSRNVAKALIGFINLFRREKFRV